MRPQSGAQSLGWGSNIETARFARAAETALRQKHYVQALNDAQRAAKDAPNNPQLWFLLGYAARLNHRYQLSIAAYRHGLRLNPSAVAGLSGIAQDDSLLGRTQEARRLLKKVVAVAPNRRSDVVLLGSLYMRSGDYAKATRWLRQAERSRQEARSELLLAICYQHLKKMKLARHYLRMAQKKAPNNVGVERSLASYYNTEGDYVHAIAALRSIRNPKAGVIAELAYTYQLDGKMKDSARMYLKAANEESKNFDLQIDAAHAQVVAGSIGKANKLLARAAALKANSYRLEAIKAEIAQLQGRNEDAAREYKAALARLPANPSEGPLYGIQLHMDLVALYQKLEEPDAAHHELGIAESQIARVSGSGFSKEKFLRLRARIELDANSPHKAFGDISQALLLDPHNHADLQLDGDILMKLGRTEKAMAAYKQILASNPNDRFALISMGYACRAAGHDQEAKRYFERLAKADPTSSAPYLALGDLYTAHRKYHLAQTAYAKGYSLNPKNVLIVADAINAAIEAHDLNRGSAWMGRIQGRMKRDPNILRQEERFLGLDGKYAQSAQFGEQAIKKLPDDRDVVVYLGYDYLHLDKYKQLLALTSKYLNVLPKEPDIPLLAGYVNKHEGNDKAALKDFTEVLKRDPNVVTAYVNRGYVLSDLHQPKKAAADFEQALKRNPKDGEAHLGLAYASLDLNKPGAALRQAELAEKTAGDSRDVHIIRATAYGREGMLDESAHEFRAALRFTPNDPSLHFGLGNALFSERRYSDAINQFQKAAKLNPGHAQTYALLARAYAQLKNQDETLHYVQLAEKDAQSAPSPAGKANPELSSVLVSTGQALDTLGERQAAMKRFRRALDMRGGNRVAVRLAIAQEMVQQGQSQDAEREVALAWMEAEAGETAPPSGGQFIEAADIFRSLHEYRLSQSYLERAKTAGAPDEAVRLGLADNDLALGETLKAEAELAAIHSEKDDPPSYQYLMTKASLLRQKHENAKALTAFAQAANTAGNNQAAEQQMLQAGADEGLRITPKFSLLSNFSVQPIFEDSTVYVLDSKLDASFAVPSSDTALLPPPRSSIQTQWRDAFHLHLGKLPAPDGFFQVRNARGRISVPSTNSVVKRDTTDTTFNFGLNPTIHLGDNVATFNAGVQETIQRDSISPADMNQNLFRVFAYMSTSSFFNAVSVNGYFIRETGPFTEINLHSRTLAGALNFRVGAPWSKTALLTGWGVHEELFMPARIEDHYTSSYIGMEHDFSHRVNFRAVLEDLRAWRIFGGRAAIAQELRPSGSIEFEPKRNWDVQFSSAYTSTRGFHVYDAIQNGISVSYQWPVSRTFGAESGPVSIKYPIRFSAGLQEQSFFNFPGPRSEQFRPYVQINLF